MGTTISENLCAALRNDLTFLPWLPRRRFAPADVQAVLYYQ